MRRRSVSFRWHLVAITLLAVCPLVLVCSYFFHRLAEIERQQLENSVSAVARQATELIDREIESVKAALLALRTSPFLDSDDLTAFHAQASQVVAGFPGNIISVRGSGGRILMLTARPADEELGRTASPMLLDADRRAVATLEPVVSGLYLGTVTHVPFTSVVVPVVRDGHVKYMLNMTLTPARILNVVRSVPLDAGGVVGVVDGQGNIIARTRDHDRFVGSSASAEFIAATAGERGTFRGVTLDRISVLNAFERSKVSGWIVSAGIPLTTLEQPIERSRKIIIALVCLAVLLSVLLSIGYGVYVAKPIAALRGSARDLGASRDVRAIKTGITELDTVSLSLHQASEDLRKRDREQFLLINELNHRVKNTLTIIQSIARRTARQSSTVPELSRALEGRLMALAISHDALTATNWQGANIAQLVEHAFQTFSQTSDRATISGPAVALSNRASLAMTMMLHELCTNATKYGALSSGGGSVRVFWCQEGDQIIFRWIESDGPRVASPGRTGFGTELIRACVQHDLGGSCNFEFSPEGLTFEARLPVRSTLLNKAAA